MYEGFKERRKILFSQSNVRNFTIKALPIGHSVVESSCDVNGVDAGAGDGTD